MQDKIKDSLSHLGIGKGDVVLIRGALKSLGRAYLKDINFLDAILEVIGKEGTLVSLAFTKSSTILPPKKSDHFNVNKPTYAGAIPQLMLDHPESYRSQHPMCSFVAIGKHAEYITAGHDHTSPAYAPMEKIMELGGKGVLVGCVKSSPGFTTAHLAEYKLGMHKLVILPKLTTTYFRDKTGEIKLFRRPDLGLCSQSYYKFYAYYVREGVLQSARVGEAYSIMVPLQEAYKIEYDLLKKDRKFNICNNPICVACYARRWDRLLHIPRFCFSVLKNYISKKCR